MGLVCEIFEKSQKSDQKSESCLEMQDRFKSMGKGNSEIWQEHIYSIRLVFVNQNDNSVQLCYLAQYHNSLIMLCFKWISLKFRWCQMFRLIAESKHAHFSKNAVWFKIFIVRYLLWYINLSFIPLSMAIPLYIGVAHLPKKF